MEARGQCTFLSDRSLSKQHLYAGCLIQISVSVLLNGRLINTYVYEIYSNGIITLFHWITNFQLQVIVYSIIFLVNGQIIYKNVY